MKSHCHCIASMYMYMSKCKLPFLHRPQVHLFTELLMLCTDLDWIPCTHNYEMKLRQADVLLQIRLTTLVTVKLAIDLILLSLCAKIFDCTRITAASCQTRENSLTVGGVRQQATMHKAKAPVSGMTTSACGFNRAPWQIKHLVL